MLFWSHPLFGIMAALLGACVGSFLNVVIYRLPRGLSVNSPKRSFCPHCKTKIPMWRNVPLVTWLLQRGKCASCGESIAVRYFVVELFTALVWLGCWYVFADPAQSIFFMLLSAVCIAICVIDMEWMVIPRQLTIVGTVLGIAFSAGFPEYVGESLWYRGLLKSVYGFALGWLGLWSVVLLGKIAFGKRALVFEEPTRWMLKEPENESEELRFVMEGEEIGWSDIFFRKNDVLVLKEIGELRLDGVARHAENVRIRENEVCVDDEVFSIENLKSLDGTAKKAIVPREAMGMGDVDLLGMLGACFGPLSLIFTVFAASVVSIVWAALNRVGLGRMMPFGPSLILGALLWLFWGEDLWGWYLRALGL